jgi:hypothetical protein
VIAPPEPLQPYSEKTPKLGSCTPSVEELPAFVVVPYTVRRTGSFSLKTTSKFALPDPGKYWARHSM